MLLTRCSVVVLMCLVHAVPAQAWSPSIQGVISLSAFEALPEDQQVTMVNLLRHHPQYKEMIAPPEGSDPDQERAIIVFQASTWPDRIAGTEYDRPTWHFCDGMRELEGGLVPPLPNVELPTDAAQKPHELNLLQALKLSHHTLANQTNLEADRAIALCWVLNLTANQHQALRILSTQAPPTFADGDDHGREIIVAGVPLFDLIENYPNRRDDLASALALKEKFQQHAEWDANFERSDFVEKIGKSEAMVELADIIAGVLYVPVADDIEDAVAKGTPSPLQIGPEGYFKRHLLPAFMPQLCADAAGLSKAVLADSL